MRKYELDTLPIDIKYEVVNHLNNLPQEIQTYIKLHINEPDWNARIYSYYGESTTLNPQASIARYIQKGSYQISDKETNKSFYQDEYCKILSKIDNIASNNKTVSGSLYEILNMEAHTIDAIVSIEKTIANFIHKMIMNREQTNLPYICYIINSEIMPYHYKTYTLHSKLLSNTKEYNLPPTEDLYMINKMIHTLIQNRDELENTEYDIAVLIYLYFTKLGVQRDSSKFESRFKWELKFFEKSGEYCQRVKDILNNFRLNDSNDHELLSTLTYPHLLENAIKIPKYKFKTEDSSSMKELNGMIITFKRINSFTEEELNDLALNIRGLSLDEISKYVNFSEDNITFYLSENDYGHLLHYPGVILGTVLDNFSHEMKYIMYYEDDFYLLFKNMYNTPQIYGLSIHRNQDESGQLCRKVFSFKESKAFFYKYIYDM